MHLQRHDYYDIVRSQDILVKTIDICIFLINSIGTNWSKSEYKLSVRLLYKKKIKLIDLLKYRLFVMENHDIWLSN